MDTDKHKNNDKRTVLHAGKFLSLIKEGRWEYAERESATGACIILAVTPEQKLLMVEQYRIPLHKRVIELPAGIVGDEEGGRGEAIEDAAKRELLEETGWSAGKVKVIMTGPTSSGLASEVVTLLRATDLKRENAGGGVGHEEITVHEIPVAEVHDWLAAKMAAGLMVDTKLYAGLYFLERKT